MSGDRLRFEPVVTEQASVISEASSLLEDMDNFMRQQSAVVGRHRRDGFAAEHDAIAQDNAVRVKWSTVSASSMSSRLTSPRNARESNTAATGEAASVRT